MILDGGETLLAYDGDRPVAMIASYTRPYIMNRSIVRIREACDWFCLPEYRFMGLGPRLMSNLMEEPEPLLTVGGAEEAQAVLRALKWRQLQDVRNYLLPLSTGFLVSRVRRRLRLPVSGPRGGRLPVPLRRLWRPLRSGRSRGPSWHHLALSETLPGLSPGSAPYDLLPLIRKHEIGWLKSAPKEMGTFFCLVFPESSASPGFSVGRLFSHESLMYAKLIHIQTSTPSVEVYARMITETILYARNQGADVAQLRASCPLLQQALKDFAFIWSVPNSSYWWAKDGRSPGNRSHLTFLRGDEGILPYPP